MANSDSNSGVAYLLSLEAVRQRSQTVLRAAEAGRLNNFNYDAHRMPEAADFVVSIIQRDFGPDRFNEIPPHGRWQHFDVGGIARIAPLLEKWTTTTIAQKIDKLEATRRLIDLFVVSVLLDAGAGDIWTFTEPETGYVYNRSEGIAVASLYMVLSGAFNSSSSSEPLVDALGLIQFTDEVFIKFFQVTSENPIIGVSSRVRLLNNVGRSLLQLPDIVGPTGRPGNIVDYLVALSTDNVLDYKLMWSVLQRILIPSWPADRPTIDGQPIGDAWPLQMLAQAAPTTSAKSAEAIQPFHKLTQWLGYSLIVPFVRVLGMTVVNEELGTGLPEYRNGGLFVDLGILNLKPGIAQQHTIPGENLPRLAPTADAIVEWRAMTVALLDELFVLVSTRFAEQGIKLSMAQMLEAGTWKGGRELAAKLRPKTKSSPIILDGDGTLF